MKAYVKSKDEALRMANTDFPVVAVQHGRLYLSATIIATLAGGIAAVLIARSQLDDLSQRVKDVETESKTVATKADVDRVADRLDALYNLMIERQEANPTRRRP